MKKNYLTVIDFGKSLRSIALLITFLLSGICVSGQGIIVNEASNGSGGSEDWVEFLVLGDPLSPTAPVDLTGWIFDDNNGEFEGSLSGVGIAQGSIVFSSAFNSVVPGSLIVIYNQSAKDPIIPADDPTDSNADNIYILPGNHASLTGCTNLPTSSDPSYLPCTSTTASWSRTAFRNGGDAAQTRMPDGTFFHGFSYGDVDASTVRPLFPSGLPSFNAGLGGTGSTFAMQCGNWEVSTNFIRSAAAGRTPAASNSVDNQLLIDNITNGSFNYSDYNDPNNCVATAPEIDVLGNTISIIGDGTNTPNVADGTDFGLVTTGTSSAEQLFTIENTGTSDLTIDTGATFTTNPAFTITTTPTSPVPSGGSTTIGVTFNAPATLGVNAGVLFITNSDSDENPYQINLQAESIAVVVAPEIVLLGSGTSILGDGTNVPNLADGTDFGSVAQGTSSTERFFTIENTGGAALDLNPSFTTDPAFVVTTLPTTPVPAGGSTIIGVTFSAPMTLGDTNATLIITNSDSDENPFQINLKATSTADTDGDGIMDLTDLDDDNDGILDLVEGTADTDGDGIVNSLDLDSDNDGIADVVEAGYTDSDMDGLIDGFIDADGNGYFDGLETPELYPQDNAASTISEVDATSSWTTGGGAGITFVSEPTLSHQGDYSLGLYTTVAGGGRNILFHLSATVGTTYNIRIWARRGTSTSGMFATWTGFSGFTTTPFTSDDWTLYEWTLTATAVDPTIQVYAHSTSGETNGSIFIDEISIREASIQVLPDTNGNGVPDYLDLDSDYDGCYDALEGAGSYTVADLNVDGSLSATVDSRGIPGGVLQATAIDVTDDTIVSSICDTDGDGVVFTKDLDDDNDGIVDTEEGTGDTDGDGVANSVDLDSDNDGISDLVESGNIDTNNDGIIDGFIDTDGTGLHDPLDNPELYSQDNAASILTEVDAITGWVSSGVGVTLTSDATESIDGSFSLNFSTTVAGGGRYIDYNMFPVTIGANYHIQIWAKQNSNADARFTSFGLNGLPLTVFTSNEWTLYEWVVTPTVTDPHIFIYPHGTSAGTNGTIHIDGISIREVVQQTLVNNDSDTFVDYLDLDSDNDGIPDNIEAQTTLGYISPDGVFDLNGFDTAYIGGVTPVNTDGVDNPDYLDLDSDNEGADDTTEAGLTLSGVIGNNGLDSNSETADDYSDVNGIFDNPQADFPDSDGDINFGGDVDFRDSSFALDTDGDSVPDIADLDDDNDGILDTLETGGQDPSIDGDGDGIPYYLDDDDSNDAIGDDNGLIEPGFDSDGDGTANHLDIDADNDGVFDIHEAGHSEIDSDGDGMIDGVPADFGANGLHFNIETDDTQTATLNYALLDSDSDLTSDFLDVDDDDDGVNTIFENPDPDGNGDPSDAQNTDVAGGDTTPDYLDVDDDGDGVNTIFENPDPDGNGDPSDAQNTDAAGGDTIPDYLDIDDDGDGIDTINESPDPNGDNDPADALDSDGDTIPNYLDPDDDNDGIDTADEDTNGDGDPTNDDSDGDGVPNYLDLDSDNDGIPDSVETAVDSDGDTIPDSYDLDSDNDGITDSTEAGGIDNDGDGVLDSFTDANSDGLDDTIAASPLPVPDSDGDGTNDYLDIDSDNDTLTDTIEAGGADADNNGIIDGFTDVNGNGYDDATEATPLTVSNKDGDGVPDFLDLDSDNDGILDATELNIDTDLDGILDYLDLDSDADGISDIIEAGGIDSDGDAHVDYPVPGDPTTMVDADGDGLADSIDPDQGGTALPVPNSDGTADADYVDIDADDDGIVDNIEAQTTINYIAPALTDVDADGLDDNYDGDDELTIGISGGAGPFGAVVPTNSDGAADLPDYLDLDSDDDGDLDSLEGWDTDNDGTPNIVPSLGDADNDGLDNAYDADDTLINPTNGQTPASFPDLDTPGGEPDWREALDIDWDNDGIDDFADLDDDNDGIPDTDENEFGLDPDADGDGDGVPYYLDDDDASAIIGNDDGLIQPGFDVDLDGVPNHLDLDSDNDGIYDLVESGQLDPGNNVADVDNNGIIDAANSGTVGTNGLFDNLEDAPDSGNLANPTADTDTDGIVDALEVNADNDGCNDVTEAGFDDGADGNDYLGVGIPGAGLVTDVNGVVVGQGGYTEPADGDSNGIYDFQEIGAQVTLNAQQPQDQVIVISATANFDVTGSSSPVYQWFQSIDNGVNWTPLSNGGTNPAISGVDTDILTLIDVPGSYDGYLYRVVLSSPAYACGGDVTSESALLTVYPDFDGDGIGDPVDLDDDNDGVLDTVEGTGDLDGDGFPNHHDIDADGDGIFDIYESGQTAGVDAGGDGMLDGPVGTNGIPDSVDPADDGTLNYTLLDTDGDTQLDILDIDDDGDGINTVNEGADPNGDQNPNDAINTDGDSRPNYLDVDDDGDGILTSHEGSSNPDGDGRANYLDLDSDNDGIPDNVEGQTTADYILPTGVDDDNDGLDNAYEATNGVQANDVNSDLGTPFSDGTPDYLDLDSDGDTVPDSIEGHDLNEDGLPDNGPSGDADNDGLDDSYDSTVGYGDPNGSVVSTDPATDLPDTDGTEDVNYRDFDDDGDSVHTRYENPDPNSDGDFSDSQNTDGSTGDIHPDYLDADDDGDGVPTILENPDPDGNGNPVDAQDIDGDGIPDYLDDDDDNDSIATINEDVDGDGDPTDDDSDGDGRPNYLDIDDDNDGLMTITEVTDVTLDFDNDSYPNHLDLDADGDGIPDNVEGQSTAGYVLPLGTDSDNDGLDDAYDNYDNTTEINQENYQSTNGIQPVNSDTDADSDYLDADSDNDNVPDSIEGHDFNADGMADDMPIGDSDGDGLDDAYDASIGDFLGPNGLISDPAIDLPNRDNDLENDEYARNHVDGDAEVDFRDTDDDGDGLLTIEEDGNNDGDPTNDNCDRDFSNPADSDIYPDYLDPTPCEGYFPNAFSPNGDGSNDVFLVPALAQFKNFTMEVYDRWGNIVYEYDNDGRANPEWWDGYSSGTRTINKGDRVPVGTYYYIVKYNEGGLSPRTGWVYINY